MEIRVLKREKNEVILEVEGEDHTLGNLVAKEAIKHPLVKNAYYNLPHPLQKKIELYIIIDENSDLGTVIKEIFTNIKKYLEEFRREVEEKIY